jgi:hypothetical protein
MGNLNILPSFTTIFQNEVLALNTYTVSSSLGSTNFNIITSTLHQTIVATYHRPRFTSIIRHAEQALYRHLSHSTKAYTLFEFDGLRQLLSSLFLEGLCVFFSKYFHYQ